MALNRILLIALAFAAAGCGAGVDDTVLPGPREDAIPGQSVFPAPGEDKLQKATGSGGTQTAEGAPEDIAVEPICPDPNDKSDPNCAAEDTTASGTDGTFSDGQ